MPPQPTLPTILLVEDSPEDHEAMRRTFQKAGIANPVAWCHDGDDALDYLQQLRRWADPERAPRPGLILLDLNLPQTDGREVLDAIKGDPDFCTIPVVVLTTSVDPRDVDACYRRGANSFIQKPIALDGLLAVAERIRDYWLDLVELPPG